MVWQPKFSLFSGTEMQSFWSVTSRCCYGGGGGGRGNENLKFLFLRLDG